MTSYSDFARDMLGGIAVICHIICMYTGNSKVAEINSRAGQTSPVPLVPQQQAL